MKYNAKYDRWVTKGGLVYRYDKKKDRLVQCKLTKDRKGYLTVSVKRPKKIMSVHRLVYETFVGEIPCGYEIDHLNTIRDDNRFDNLRLVTHKENCNNLLTRKHRSEALKGMHLNEETKKKMSDAHKGKALSEFGRKFKEYFEITNYENPKLYHRELTWYKRHNKVCRWEVEDK